MSPPAHVQGTLAWAACLAIVNCTAPLRAQGPADEAERALAEFKSAAEQYQMATASGDALELRPEPIMNWTNPARNNELGSIFVWEREGRPLVVGTVFTYVHSFRNTVRIKHMFHSLADGPVTATFDGQTVWRPASPGIEWRSADGTPDSDTRRRLIQMRALARRFKVTLNDDRVGTETLRLLPQPLHRYTPGELAEADGAIFAFAIGTDPEALLLIESQPSDDEPRWRYAFARFHFHPMQAELDGDRRVWSVGPEYDQRQQNVLGAEAFQERVYSTMQVSERPVGPE